MVDDIKSFSFDDGIPMKIKSLIDEALADHGCTASTTADGHIILKYRGVIVSKMREDHTTFLYERWRRQLMRAISDIDGRAR